MCVCETHVKTVHVITAHGSRFRGPKARAAERLYLKLGTLRARPA